MIGLALAAALAVAPAPAINTDDELTTITPEFVALFITMPDAQPLCDAYGGLVGVIDSMGMDYSAAQAMMEAADALIIVNVEGDTMRLDNEARDVLTDWLHDDCA